MSRPIFLTPEMIAGASADFAEQLAKARAFNGSVSYSKTFTYSADHRASLVFTPDAYAKMRLLVEGFTTEVAWHGVVSRSETDPARFDVTDILVYPQEVTGGEVEMDQEGYGKWLDEHLDDDRFFHLQFQGHSHVDFQAFPSPTDLDHQQQILSQIRKDGFYIFMIANKRHEYWMQIFDLRENVCYDTTDIELCLGEQSDDLKAFLADAKAMVQTKTYGATGGWAGKYGNYGNYSGRGYYDDYDPYDKSSNKKGSKSTTGKDKKGKITPSDDTMWERLYGDYDPDKNRK